MSNVVLHSRSDGEGRIHLEVAAGSPNTDFEVEIRLRPKAEFRELPPGYFDLIGSVNDETLIVHPQPPLPPAVEIE